MPCFNVSTNVNLDGVDTAPFFSEATKAVASIIGKPENVRILYLPLPLHEQVRIDYMNFSSIFSYPYDCYI